MNVQFLTQGGAGGFGTVGNTGAITNLYEYQNAIANGQKLLPH